MVNGQEIRKKQKYLQNVWKISPNDMEEKVTMKDIRKSRTSRYERLRESKRKK